MLFMVNIMLPVSAFWNIYSENHQLQLFCPLLFLPHLSYKHTLVKGLSLSDIWIDQEVN